MRHIFRHLTLALALCGFCACQGRGRVHETPPANYPSARAERAMPPPPAAPPTDDGYARSPAPSPAREYERADAPSSAQESSGASGPSSLAPRAEARSRKSSRGSGRWQSWEDRDQERPGLATHWGETRYSPTWQVDFERASFSRPYAVLTLHYNDRSGAHDMLPRGSWGRSELTALGGAIEVSMVDAAGQPYPALWDGDKVVAMGDPGERYALLVHNRSSRRYELVATVDGLDVLDGEEGSFQKRGYLIGSYSSIIIDGFRRSEAEVAAFRLGDVSGSYAASKGKARNVGVIGIALFEERAPRQPSRWQPEHHRSEESHRRESADPFPKRYARPPAW